MLSGVHDSYWTHASDVDKMNRILREKFVELYEAPILENVSSVFTFSLFSSVPVMFDGQCGLWCTPTALHSLQSSKILFINVQSSYLLTLNRYKRNS